MRFEVWESPEGVVLDGVPPFTMATGGQKAVAATLQTTSPGSPFIYLDVEFDAAPVAGDVIMLQVPSNAMRNKYGGNLQAGRVSWPAGGVVTMPIYAAPEIYDATTIRIVFSAVYGPVCIGPGFTVQNQTTMDMGTMVGLSGGGWLFYMGSGVTAGDVIDIPGNQLDCKGQWGGNLEAYNGPI